MSIKKEYTIKLRCATCGYEWKGHSALPPLAK